MRYRMIAVVALINLGVTTCLTPQASAKGFSFTFTPKGDAASAIRTGWSIYGIARDVRNHAKTKQHGSGNGAAISQHGQGNSGLVVQQGRDNSGTLTQKGNYNLFGLFQFGRHNTSSVVQNGNGKVGITVQGGW